MVLPDTQPLDIATYNYYRGSIYLGLERFEDAMAAFRKVLTQPANVLHQVHQDAYDRLTLLSLIIHGKKYELYGSGIYQYLKTKLRLQEQKRAQQGNDGMIYEPEAVED